jgi:hypothetical protein
MMSVMDLRKRNLGLEEPGIRVVNNETDEHVAPMFRAHVRATIKIIP